MRNVVNVLNPVDIIHIPFHGLTGCSRYIYMKVTLTVNRCGTKGLARW
jgi:hypothetical protein